MGNRHWYCIGKDGIATLCADKDDAEQSAKLASLDWPRNAPYRALQIMEADELDALQADAAQDMALIRQMLKALEHHTEQTRPIHSTETAMNAARARLGEGSGHERTN